MIIDAIKTMAGLIAQFGPATVVSAVVIVAALLVINRESKRRIKEAEAREEERKRLVAIKEREIESRLDDTETLRTITREDRNYLQKAQERNQLLLESNMEMLRQVGGLQQEVAVLKEERDNDKEMQAAREEAWKSLTDSLKNEIEDLRLRIIDLETIGKTKDIIISQYQEKYK